MKSRLMSGWLAQGEHQAPDPRVVTPDTSLPIVLPPLVLARKAASRLAAIKSRREPLPRHKQRVCLEAGFARHGPSLCVPTSPGSGS